MEQPSIISQIQIKELKSCFIIVFQKYPFAVLCPHFFFVLVSLILELKLLLDVCQVLSTPRFTFLLILAAGRFASSVAITLLR